MNDADYLFSTRLLSVHNMNVVWEKVYAFKPPVRRMAHLLL